MLYYSAQVVLKQIKGKRDNLLKYLPIRPKSPKSYSTRVFNSLSIIMSYIKLSIRLSKVSSASSLASSLIVGGIDYFFLEVGVSIVIGLTSLLLNKSITSGDSILAILLD